MKKLGALLFAVVVTFGTISAEIIEHVKIGDLFYNLNTDNRQAEVTYKSSGTNSYSYLTVFSIPEEVIYNEIPFSVTSIGDYAFKYCENLTAIVIPNTVKTIGDYSFEYCSSLSSVTIPNSVTTIGEYAFQYCRGMNSITISNSVISIGRAAFLRCVGLKQVVLPNQLAVIEDGVFQQDSSLVSVSIPSSVTSIGQSAFLECVSMTSIVIPEGTANIGLGAFNSCGTLKNVELPSTLTNIKMTAFYNCIALASITCKALTPPTLELQVFYGVNQPSCKLFVPSNSVSLYENAGQWRDFKPILAIGSTEAVETVLQNNEPRTKVIRNGQVFIENSNNTYTLTGQQLK